jgi:hypothetical protein
LPAPYTATSNLIRSTLNFDQKFANPALGGNMMIPSLPFRIRTKSCINVLSCPRSCRLFYIPASKKQVMRGFRACIKLSMRKQRRCLLFNRIDACLILRPPPQENTESNPREEEDLVKPARSMVWRVDAAGTNNQ